jgi:hypothetical protein
MAVPEPGEWQQDVPVFEQSALFWRRPAAGWVDAVRVLIVYRHSGQTEVQSYGDRLPAEDDDDPHHLGLEQFDRYLKPLEVNAFDASA